MSTITGDCQYGIWLLNQYKAFFDVLKNRKVKVVKTLEDDLCSVFGAQIALNTYPFRN